MEPIFNDRFKKVVRNIKVECSDGMLGMGGDGDNRPGKGASFEEIEPNFFAEGEVEKNQIGPAFIDEGYGFGRVGGFSTYLNMRKAKKDIAKVLTTEGFVIDQDGSQGFHLRLFVLGVAFWQSPCVGGLRGE